MPTNHKFSNVHKLSVMVGSTNPVKVGAVRKHSENIGANVK